MRRTEDDGMRAGTYDRLSHKWRRSGPSKRPSAVVAEVCNSFSATWEVYAMENVLVGAMQENSNPPIVYQRPQ